MGQLYRYACLLAAMVFFITACNARSIQRERAGEDVSKSLISDMYMGKSLTENAIADFLVVHQCHRLNQFQICEEMGMALETSADQVIETVFIYLKNIDGFSAYTGELPFGLESSDTRETVESKFRQQRVGTGTPNERGLLDRTHSWATYYSAGMTIIYESPSADDRSAKMHAILVTR
jgi:hypothetical protein